MEIKRITEIFVKTKRRFVIRRSDAGETALCRHCGEPVVAAETAAVLLGVKTRVVYKLVETGNVHFTENESGATLVCPASAAFLENRSTIEEK